MREVFVYRAGVGVIPRAEAEEIDRLLSDQSPSKLFEMPDVPEKGHWAFRDGKLVPVSEVHKVIPANVAHGVISDEMAPTKNPLNPREVFTSKSKLRAVYKAHGAEEIGTAYDNGYDPGKRYFKEKEQRLHEKLHVTFKEHLNRGR